MQALAVSSGCFSPSAFSSTVSKETASFRTCVGKTDNRRVHLCKCKAAFRLNRPTLNCQLESWAGALVSKYAVRTIYTRIEAYQAELRSCVRVEVAVLGSPSLISLTVSVDVRQH